MGHQAQFHLPICKRTQPHSARFRSSPWDPYFFQCLRRNGPQRSTCHQMLLPNLENQKLVHNDYLSQGICMSKVHHIKASINPHATIRKAKYRMSSLCCLFVDSITTTVIAASGVFVAVNFFID